jgi:hypothetical protein
VTVDRPTYTYTVLLRIAGLPSGSLAVLALTAPDASVVRTADGRCLAEKVAATCQVTGGSDVSTVTFEVIAPKGTAVEASLTPISRDPNPDNNTWRARLD